MARISALALLTLLLGSCNLLNPGAVSCASAEDCFFGYSCVEGTCSSEPAPPAPDAGVPGPDAGDPEPDGGSPVPDAGLPDAGPVGLDAGPDGGGIVLPCEPLAVPCDGCFAPEFPGVIAQDNFEAGGLPFCPPLTGPEGTLSGATVAVDLQEVPGSASLRLRVVVRWDGARVRVMYNVAAEEDEGTGFELSTVPSGTKVEVRRGPEALESHTIESLPAGVYFVELINDAQGTALLITRGSFVGTRGAEILALIRVDAPPGAFPGDGTGLFLRTNEPSGIDRFELVNPGLAAHPLDDHALVDTFIRGAIDAPEWPIGADPWLTGTGTPRVSDLERLACDSSPCSVGMFLPLNVAPPFRARFHTRRSASAGSRAVGSLATRGMEHDELELTALGPGISGSTRSPSLDELFAELRVGADELVLTGRSASFNGPLVFAVRSTDVAGLVLTPLVDLTLDDATARSVVVEQQLDFDAAAVVVFDDFAEPTRRGATLVPVGGAWSPAGSYLDGGGVSGAFSTAVVVPGGQDLRARFLATPEASSLAFTFTLGDVVLTLDNSSDLVQLGFDGDNRQIAEEDIPNNAPLFGELTVRQSGEAAVTVRTDSFGGPVVAALELIEAVTGPFTPLGFTVDTGRFDSVELAEVPDARSGLLFFDTFHDVGPTEYPAADIALTGLARGGGALTLDALADVDQALTAIDDIGYNVVARAIITTAETLSGPIQFGLRLNDSGGAVDAPGLLLRSSTGGIDLIGPDSSTTIAGFNLSPNQTYFIQLDITATPGTQAGRIEARVSSVSFSSGPADATLTFTAFNNGPVFDNPAVPKTDQIVVKLQGNVDEVQLEQLVVERLP